MNYEIILTTQAKHMLRKLSEKLTRSASYLPRSIVIILKSRNICPIHKPSPQSADRIDAREGVKVLPFRVHGV
jgi:hypothetical protein